MLFVFFTDAHKSKEGQHSSSITSSSTTTTSTLDLQESQEGENDLSDGDEQLQAKQKYSKASQVTQLESATTSYTLGDEEYDRDEVPNIDLRSQNTRVESQSLSRKKDNIAMRSHYQKQQKHNEKANTNVIEESTEMEAERESNHYNNQNKGHEVDDNEDETSLEEEDDSSSDEGETRTGKEMDDAPSGEKNQADGLTRKDNVGRRGHEDRSTATSKRHKEEQQLKRMLPKKDKTQKATLNEDKRKEEKLPRKGGRREEDNIEDGGRMEAFQASPLTSSSTPTRTVTLTFTYIDCLPLLLPLLTSLASLSHLSFIPSSFVSSYFY